MRDIGVDLPVRVQTDTTIAQYSGLGTSRLRRLLLRSGYSRHFIAQMNAAVALVGRLVNLTASMRTAFSSSPVRSVRKTGSGARAWRTTLPNSAGICWRDS